MMYDVYYKYAVNYNGGNTIQDIIVADDVEDGIRIVKEMYKNYDDLVIWDMAYTLIKKQATTDI